MGRKWRSVYTSPDTRFREKFWVSEAGCWRWTGGLSNGRPFFMPHGERVTAHKWAYEKYIDTQEGILFNECGSLLCVNPWHYRKKLRKPPKVQQGRRRTRTHCIRLHPLTKENLALNGGRTPACKECRRYDQWKARADKRDGPPCRPYVPITPPDDEKYIL